MLKTLKDGDAWLVAQPDHGLFAGYLAAHWGNARFQRPGGYAGVSDPERLRAETIFAEAQHDNGWWEWDASPDLGDDGLPLGLAEVLKNQQGGMDRWRRGLSRFPRSPYVNLLLSGHAHWLYAISALPDPDPAFTHPLFWKAPPANSIRAVGRRRSSSSRNWRNSAPNGWKPYAPTPPPRRGSKRRVSSRTCACSRSATASSWPSAPPPSPPAPARPRAWARTSSKCAMSPVPIGVTASSYSPRRSAGAGSSSTLIPSISTRCPSPSPRVSSSAPPSAPPISKAGGTQRGHGPLSFNSSQARTARRTEIRSRSTVGRAGRPFCCFHKPAP
jgi:hypothetical protein